MEWTEIIVLIIGGSSIFSQIGVYYFSRKKTRSEVRHSEIDADQKIDEYKDKDRLNAYKKYDELQVKYDNLLDVVTDIKEDRAKSSEERTLTCLLQDTRMDRIEKELSEANLKYKNSRCDDWNCSKRMPPLTNK